jgi:hypothetical protein
VRATADTRLPVVIACSNWRCLTGCGMVSSRADEPRQRRGTGVEDSYGGGAARRLVGGAKGTGRAQSERGDARGCKGWMQRCLAFWTLGVGGA